MKIRSRIYSIARFNILFIFLLISACIHHEKSEQGSNHHEYDLMAKVIHLKDGDSFIVLDDEKKQIEIRLIDIDAPELHQAFGRKSKAYLSKLIKGKRVGIDYDRKDKYDRFLADVYLDNLYINLEMVKAGYAWHFTRFSNDEELQQAEDKARELERGLWKDANPQAPWDWRNSN